MAEKSATPTAAVPSPRNRNQPALPDEPFMDPIIPRVDLATTRERPARPLRGISAQFCPRPRAWYAELVRRLQSGGGSIGTLVLVGALGAIPARAQPSEIVDPWPAALGEAAVGPAELPHAGPPCRSPGDALGEVVDPWAKERLDLPPIDDREEVGVEAAPAPGPVDGDAGPALDVDLVDPWSELVTRPAGSHVAAPRRSPALTLSAMEIVDPWTRALPRSDAR